MIDWFTAIMCGFICLMGYWIGCYKTSRQIYKKEIMKNTKTKRKKSPIKRHS